MATDFTGDGVPDIIVNGDRGQTMLYIAPRWDKIIIALPPSKSFHPKHATHSEIMDVDGDGDPDYIGAYFKPGLIFWLERPENPRPSPL